MEKNVYKNTYHEIRKVFSLIFVEDIVKCGQVVAEKSWIGQEMVMTSRQSATYPWFFGHCSIVLVA